MSSQEYSLDNDDPCVHLTNNAVQKYAEDYGKYEEGNILSFKDLIVRYFITLQDDISLNRVQNNSLN
jgi:hypothetical protein